MICVGLISDTHSLLRPQALSLLAGCERILHAGDIGCLQVLEDLSKVAPVAAIRGNIDTGAWASSIAPDATISIDGKSIYLLHNIKDLKADPIAAGFDVVVYGHSHKPKIERIDGILYVNPGSAGPRRFNLPISVAKLFITEESIEGRIFEIAL